MFVGCSAHVSVRSIELDIGPVRASSSSFWRRCNARAAAPPPRRTALKTLTGYQRAWHA